MTDLAQRIHAASCLTGQFTLRSGRVAAEYFDKYRFESDPKLLSEIALQMVPLIPTGTEVLAGLEMGGIAIVTMLSHHSGLPASFVRKTAKAHGTARFSEGADVAGKRILVVEDIVTSGGQVILAAADLRSLGARIDHALCVIDRQEGDGAVLAAADITLLSLFKRQDFERL